VIIQELAAGYLTNQAGDAADAEGKPDVFGSPLLSQPKASRLCRDGAPESKGSVTLTVRTAPNPLGQRRRLFLYDGRFPFLCAALKVFQMANSVASFCRRV
jgi:hypothetical protein